MSDHRVNWDGGSWGPPDSGVEVPRPQQGCSRRLLSGGEKPWENHNVRALSNLDSVNLLTRPHFYNLPHSSWFPPILLVVWSQYLQCSPKPNN